jgi:hypothetical protein
MRYLVVTLFLLLIGYLKGSPKQDSLSLWIAEYDSCIVDSIFLIGNRDANFFSFESEIKYSGKFKWSADTLYLYELTTKEAEEKGSYFYFTLVLKNYSLYPISSKIRLANGKYTKPFTSFDKKYYFRRKVIK